MPAPKGNKYAVGNRGGRPTKLTAELMEKAHGYLDWQKTQPKLTRFVSTKLGVQEVEVENPPTLVGLSLYIDVNNDTLTRWAKESEEFRGIFTRVKDAYEACLIRNGMTDKFNARLTQFLLSADLAKREKTDITSDNKALPTPILNVVVDAKPSPVRHVDPMERTDD